MPTVKEIEAAGLEALLRWNRFLPSPQNDGEVAALNLIVERLGEKRVANPTGWVTASKAIGWER